MPTPSKPTLIIGLGGVGCRIVEGVYRQFEASHPEDIDRRNVEFLCLDTDESDINKRRKVMPENNVVKTSSDLSDTVGGYIDRIKGKTTVTDWFDTSSQQLLGMPLNKGAAQVRMASRLALMSAINEGKLAAIDNSISRLMAVEPERHAGNIIRTYIVTSLAGGTGAGSFLQIAYYVKNSMRDHGANAPEVDGFFLLADVLCDDASIGLSDDQKENIRSNTYACMKEMLAFSSSDRDEALKKVEFEYRLGQKDKGLPSNQPYDQCYIIDYTAASGENLGKESRYESQVESFVYLTAFSPTGDQYRSNVINNIRQQIQDETKKFASLGVSKLVYPVDDMFAYFARQRVTDNMRASWCLIDKDYQEKYAEYKKNKREGIPTPEPDKGQHFMDMVKQLAASSGSQGAEFGEIYRSTQVLDKDFKPIKSKASEYLAAMQRFAMMKVNTSGELDSRYSECVKSNVGFTTKDVLENDVQFVVKRERALEDYRNQVFSFIDNVKRITPKQCFLDDHDNENYVSKTPQEDLHHLNTFILSKDEELHPLAVRYFLYDLRDQIKPLLKKKKTANETLEKKIKEDYSKLFDDPTTKKVETAVDTIQGSHQKRTGLSGLANRITGQNPYRRTKEDYEAKSRMQADNIKKFASEKLLEETLSTMLNYINRLLEESEGFFDRLPVALEEVDNIRVALLKKHDSLNDKDITYVLASEQIKKDIYNFVVSRNDSPFFPTVMSAALYRSMYHNVAVELAANKFVTSKTVDEETKKQAAIEANKRIIEECVAYQDKLIRESNRDYAQKNVIAALKEEAMRESNNDPVAAKEYMEHKFQMFREQAKFWGPNDLDPKVRFINAWGFHPDCVGSETISAKDADALFGDERVDTNPENAATRLVSKFFSPYEIVRANSVTLLSINKHFKKFHAKEKTDLTDEYFGPYFTAYRTVIDRVFASDKRSRSFTHGVDSEVLKDCSPHLDKRWHLPAYMPNIGSSYMEETTKLYHALCYGLLSGDFKAVYNGGEYYWKFISNTSKFIRDIDLRMIGIGQTLEGAFNNLFEKGLVNNPDIVNQVLEANEERWKEAKNQWLDTGHDETNELAMMKEHPMVKAIVEFNFNLCPTPAFKTTKNWFTLLTARKGSTLFNVLEKHDGYLRHHFLTNLVERIIEVFGQSSNTQSLCEYILSSVGTIYADDAKGVLREFKEKGCFEPVE